jgi:hypothetical protein
VPFSHASKGNPVNDRVIHAHHQGRRDDKFPVLVIDLVHRFGNRMGTLGKDFQLFASGLSSPKRACYGNPSDPSLPTLYNNYFYMPRKGRKPGAWSGGITFKLSVLIFLVLIIVVLIIASSGTQPRRKSAITPTKPAQGFAWPTAVVFTDDEQFKVLKKEDALLQFGDLGREYFRKESHSGLTGGFYAGIPVGADFYMCYASAYQLADVVDLIDTRFQSNAWYRYDRPGYTIETVKEVLQNNADIRGYNLAYVKETPIGTVAATIYFFQDQMTNVAPRALPRPCKQIMEHSPYI